MQLFSPYWVMNSTGLDLEYRTIGPMGTDDETISHFQSDPYVILPSKRNEITVACLKSSRSEKILINTVGHLGTIFCPASGGDLQSYTLGLAVTASSFGLTSIVNISPFYFVLNRTDFAIEVAEVFLNNPTNQRFWMEVRPNSKEPFWPNRESFLVVRRARTNFVSQPLDYRKGSDQGVLLHTGDISGLFAEVTQNDNECLISFAPYFSGSAAFHLINLTGFPVSYRQHGRDRWSKLDSCHSVLYTWSEPIKERDLEVEVNPDLLDSPISRKTSSISRMKSNATSMISWNRLNNTALLKENGDDAMKMKEINIAGATIFVIPIFIGTQRTVVFTQNETHKSKLESSEKQVTQFDIQTRVKAIQLSFVDSFRRQEVSLVSLTGTGALWHQQRGKGKWKEVPEEVQYAIEHRFKLKQFSPFRYKQVDSPLGRDNIFIIDIGKMTIENGKKVAKLNRSERPGLDMRYQIKENSTTLDLKLQNIQEEIRNF